jgi:hypothetical protein
VIQRLWRNQAPGESSAPSHAIGGAAYARYQFSPKFAAAGRAEYLSDRGGLFSGLTQALKETTATFDYKLGDGFLMRYEWRRDFSNQPSFLTSTQGLLSKEQTTATHNSLHSCSSVFEFSRKANICHSITSVSNRRESEHQSK